MEQTIRTESLKDYEKNITAYHLKEIVPYAAKRKLFQPEDVGRLGTSATHLGMDKIRAKTKMGKYSVDFLNKATIHGLNHIVAPRRHFFERILTILFLGIALACLVTSSLNYWYQYQNNPTSMVIDFDYKNFNITKPAATVCLYEPVSMDKFPDVFKKFGVADTQEARNFFLFISKPVYSTMNQTPVYNDTPPNKWLEILWNLYPDMEIISCQDSSCTSPNTSNTVVVTEKGLCTGISGRYNEYSSVDYWLSNSWTIFPQNGILPAYTFIYRNERITYKNFPGSYEFTLHHPNELPIYNDFWYQIKLLGVEDLLIDVQQLESSDDVRELSQTQRPCNFPEHGELKMWPVYTHNMCILECRYNFIKHECGCYPYFARPMPGVPICNVTQLHCIGNLWPMLFSLKRHGRNFCSCPDSCDTASYTVISSERRDYKQDLAQGWFDRPFNMDCRFPFYKLRHEVFFGFNEFLVSVGGAAGLFLGASIISFVEILYYATLRLFWSKSKTSEHRKE